MNTIYLVNNSLYSDLFQMSIVNTVNNIIPVDTVYRVYCPYFSSVKFRILAAGQARIPNLETINSRTFFKTL